MHSYCFEMPPFWDRNWNQTEKTTDAQYILSEKLTVFHWRCLRIRCRMTLGRVYNSFSESVFSFTLSLSLYLFLFSLEIQGTKFQSALILYCVPKRKHTKNNQKICCFSLVPNFLCPVLTFYNFIFFVCVFVLVTLYGILVMVNVFTHFSATNVLTGSSQLHLTQSMCACVRVCVCMRVWYKHPLYTIPWCIRSMNTYSTWIKRPTSGTKYRFHC